jgi:hypothetical protein
LGPDEKSSGLLFCSAFATGAGGLHDASFGPPGSGSV